MTFLYCQLLRYMEILQKQRLEFEDLLARNLREQEAALSLQAQKALQAKEDSIQAVVQAAAEAQENEHKADLAATAERLDSELNAKYEIEYTERLTEEKAGFVKELQDKVAVIDDLASKLQQLDSALQVSRSFEIGSLQAHRLSAAAIAFNEKMAAGKGAPMELAALKVS